MYAIATEKGLNEEGKMEYEVFGVKLKELRNMKASLESINATSLLTSSDRPLLRRVLRENERDSIISDKDMEEYEKVCGMPFNWSDVELREIHKIVDFVSIGHRIDAPWYYHVEDIYDEMLDLSQKYFGGTNKKYNRIHLSPRLYCYQKAFQTIGFKLYQGTPSRFGIGSPNVQLGTGGNLSIAKSNAMILMLLTGQTTYCDMNGSIKPIVLDGFVRKPLDWQEEETEHVTSSNIYATNPTIFNDIFNSNIEDDSGKKYIYK